MTITPANLSTLEGKFDSHVWEKVLIVDDEPAILFAYRKLIEREGMIVDDCDSYDAALEFIRANRYFAVIADMRLVGSENNDGLEILRFIRREYPDTKVILSTGYGNSEIEQTVLALGATYYFEKPVMPAVILEVLHTLRTAAAKMLHGGLVPCEETVSKLVEK